jgi:hypothetical protein
MTGARRIVSPKERPIDQMQPDAATIPFPGRQLRSKTESEKIGYRIPDFTPDKDARELGRETESLTRDGEILCDLRSWSEEH